MQPLSLKYLARKVLERNKACNSPATSPQTDRNFLSKDRSPPQICRQRECSPETSTRTWTPDPTHTAKCGDVTGLTMDKQPLCPVWSHDYFKTFRQDVIVAKDKIRHAKLSPIALAWLREHRQALDDAGWTRAELYRRNKYKQGIAWLDLWDKMLLAYLQENGTIEFKCSTNDRDFIQTARPASFRAWSNDLLSGDQKSYLHEE